MKALALAAFLACSTAFAQSVTIRVNAAASSGEFRPVWNYFGYDEPNYTYLRNGRKLITELSSLSATPVHIRTHNLLTTGNGMPALKWGSTNAFTEDESGRPVYDWTIVDRILETYVHAGVVPFVEVGFMPEALSTHPTPYQHTFPHGELFTGWTYPPNNYLKWSELIYRWASHCAEKFGRVNAAAWDWEVWNEPDIGYWHGSPEEYDKLYDFTAAAIKRALPEAHVGGPATTGPANPKAAAFLRQFLLHCSSGKNYATGDQGAPLDFISFHAKGRPQWVDGGVRMGLAEQMRDVSEGFRLIQDFPKFRNLPVVLSESDPEGCAACASPRNAYRNGTLYPAYEAAALKTILTLARRDRINLEGILTWAFEFEDQPYFAGYRSLATNGVDKPVLNAFRMFGLMGAESLPAQSDGAISADSILASGVNKAPDVDALATRSRNRITVLAWNYSDARADSSAEIRVDLSGLPRSVGRLLLTRYRIDGTHSNAYTVWQQLGSPQSPSSAQYELLQRAGQLQLLDSPQWIDARDGSAVLNFSLPSESLSLLQLNWD